MKELESFTQDKLDVLMIRIADRAKDELGIALNDYFASTDAPLQFTIKTETLGTLRKYRTEEKASEGDFYKTICSINTKQAYNEDSKADYCFGFEKKKLPWYYFTSSADIKKVTEREKETIRQGTIKFCLSFKGNKKWLVQSARLLEEVEKTDNF